MIILVTLLYIFVVANYYKVEFPLGYLMPVHMAITMVANSLIVIVLSRTVNMDRVANSHKLKYPFTYLMLALT